VFVEKKERCQGCHALGTWGVSATPTGAIQVATLTPPRGAVAAGTPPVFTTTLTDTVGSGNFGVVNVPINNFIDGRRACYLAYGRPARYSSWMTAAMRADLMPEGSCSTEAPRRFRTASARSAPLGRRLWRTATH